MTDHSIMIVDDDADVRSTVADALEEEGYAVVTAANGREALKQLLDGARPSLILLDMMMPEMNGWAFRAEQQQRADLAAIPIIIFTAYGVPRDTAAQVGAQGYLRKPVRLDDLLAAVGRIGVRRNGPP